MGETLTKKILNSHLVSGKVLPGETIALSVDQTLFHDATGTMASLQFEALYLPRVKTKLSVAYIDDNPFPDHYLNLPRRENDGYKD